MLASLRSAAPPAGRTDMSQLLPTVKCSNCNRPVPLDDLSDHVCVAAPSLPKPALSPAAAVSLLPQRLQDRLVSPRTSNDVQLGGTSSSDRLRIDTASMYPSRLSHPVAPNEAYRAPSPYQKSLLNPSPTPSFDSSTPPLRTRAGTVAGTLGRKLSNISVTSYNPPPASSPATARPTFLSSRDAGPSHNLGHMPREQLPAPLREPNPRTSPVPQYPEPDTQTGGEAGMAGVGRRGFAAVARPSTSPTPGDQLRIPQPRRNNTAPFLDTDLWRHTNETPPLSAGSGNSSQSPGVSPYPQSPVGHHGLPYPDRYDLQVPPSQQIAPSLDRGHAPSLSPLRKTSFDQDGNQLASVIPGSNTMIFDNGGLETPLTAKQQQQPFTARLANDNTSASRLAARRPPSSSDSDYSNRLAYADNTDYEDEEPPVDAQIKDKANNPPPQLPLQGILRSGSTSSMNRVHFPSSIPPTQQRKSSLSSLSSSGEDDARKSNSAAIAHALGLSRAASGSYARLGGPGAQMGGRERSGTSASVSSESSQNTHLRRRQAMSGNGMGTMEKELKVLLEEKREERVDGDRRVGLSKSKSTGSQRTLAVGEGQASGVRALSAKNPSVSSLMKREKESEGKVPTRTKSSTEYVSGSRKKERVKATKVCLKCNEAIENGRWIATESGSVLCEGCWKHMYLPKCRRCDLPIENAAVSSADGQLRGKYHRECFDCHICHKSFPDKSFYVFDGMPLCKYHYHEANESLCAATLCGQPIEGPCAVSHTGDRYHPEHMLCEYPGNPPCRTKLAEYWEVAGRMLCERHAHTSEVESDDERGEEEWVQSSKRRKRVTRFIDLAGGLPSGGLR